MEAQSEEFLPPYSRPRFAIVTAIVMAITLAVFALFPVLDLAGSHYFYMPGPVSWNNSAWYCLGYALACQPTLSLIRDFLHVLPLVVGAILFGVTSWITWQRRSIFDRTVLRYGSAFWSLVVSNLVLVDLVMKDLWGRPRPYHQYIGLPRFDAYVFVPAGDWRGACESNCSFVSGEANALFWMVCATAILPARIRRPAFWITLALAIAGSLLRVAFGAHYPSDVAIGGLLAVLVFSLIAILAARIERLAGPRPTNFSSSLT